MSDFKRYYDEEMRYLLGAGREYARRYPEYAQPLSMEDAQRRDPYIERLFQNFAFLTARVRSDLDQVDDNSAGELLEQLAHGLEIPLPGMAMVEFFPRIETIETAKFVPAGSVVQASALGGMTRNALFSTTTDCVLHPLRLEATRLSAGAQGQAYLEFVLGSVDGKELAAWPESIDLHLAGDPSVAWTLHHWLARRVQRFELSVGDGSRLSCATIADAAGYCPVAAQPALALLSLRDLLCADDRFRCIRLAGLDRAVPPGQKQLRVRILFHGLLSPELERKVNDSSVRINTVPAINAYIQECEPHEINLAQSEYNVVPREETNREILDVLQVQGASIADPTQNHMFIHSWAFRQFGRKSPDHGYFRVIRRANRSGGMKTSVSVDHPDESFFFSDEFISIHAWCSDGDLPRDNLRPTDISEAGAGIPAGLALSALARPSQVFRPPMGTKYRWSLFSHFQRSYKDLLRCDTLKETLKLLMWDPREAKRELIDSIQSIQVLTGYKLTGGVPTPVSEIHIAWHSPTLKPDDWDKLGQIDVFGSCLFQLYKERVPPGMEFCVIMEIASLGIALEHFR